MAEERYKFRGLPCTDGSYGTYGHTETILTPLGIDVHGDVRCVADTLTVLGTVVTKPVSIRLTEFNQMERDGILLRIYVEAGETVPLWVPWLGVPSVTLKKIAEAGGI